MNRKLRTILSITCLLIAAGILYTGGFHTKKLILDSVQVKKVVTTTTQQQKKSNQILASATSREFDGRDIASLPSKEKESVALPKLSGARQLSMVAEFAQLKKKIFKTDSEQQSYKAFLRNRDLLLDLGKKLTDIQFIQSADFANEQNAMVDLLVEALASGDHVTSQAVVTSLVQDASVENEKLPMSVRQNLAGLKAELLYQVTALFPEEFKNVAELLPGPVSQKIWVNVQASQQRNVAESQAEQQRM